MLSQSTSITSKFPAALLPNEVTILAYGALLSEASSRLTFPDLTNFRHVRVYGMRRVFAHPHLFLLRKGLVDPSETLQLASLSAEPAERDASFVAAAFNVKLDDKQREAFIMREPEYRIASVPFYDLDGSQEKQAGVGVICAANTDDNISLEQLIPSNVHISSVWNWSKDSGLEPADIYLRHCLLAVKNAGGKAYESFLHETFLADRETNLAQYLEGVNGGRVMASRPPPELAKRFGG